MLQKVQGQAPFQVLTNAFSISPSNEGYDLQISSDGFNYSTLFSVGAGVTRMVTGVANGSYYRLLGNESEVIVNWNRSCGGGGSEGSGGTPYILPIASASELGGVKVGDGLAIDPSTGVLSVSGGSAGGDAHILLASASSPAGLEDGDVYALSADGTQWDAYNGSETGQTAFRWLKNESNQVEMQGFVNSWGEGAYSILWDNGHWYGNKDIYGQPDWDDLGTEDGSLSDGTHTVNYKTIGDYCYVILDAPSVGFWSSGPTDHGAAVEQTFAYGVDVYGVYQKRGDSEKMLITEDDIKKLLPVENLPQDVWTNFDANQFNDVRETIGGSDTYLMHWDNDEKFKGVQITNGEFDENQGYGMAMGTDGKMHCTDSNYSDITAWIDGGKLYWSNPYGKVSMLDAYGAGSDLQGLVQKVEVEEGTVVAKADGLYQMQGGSYTQYVHSADVVKIWRGTAAEYADLPSTDADTLYIIL